MKIFVLKPLGFKKLSHSLEMRNDALMHREGLKGFKGVVVMVDVKFMVSGDRRAIMVNQINQVWPLSG